MQRIVVSLATGEQTVVPWTTEEWAAFQAASIPPAPTVSQLIAYADAKRDTVSDAGIVVNIGTEQSPINVNVTTTDSGRVDVLGLMQLAALGAPLTWYQSTGNIAITAEQLTTIGTAIATHRAAAVAIHTTLWAGINATPATVTSYAQIDNAAWPT